MHNYLILAIATFIVCVAYKFGRYSQRRDSENETKKL